MNITEMVERAIECIDAMSTKDLRQMFIKHGCSCIPHEISGDSMKSNLTSDLVAAPCAPYMDYYRKNHPAACDK